MEDSYKGKKEIKYTSIEKYCAEFIGTFLLIFFGVGAIIVSKMTGVIGHTEVAMIFGVIVMILIYCLGPVSGADFNPAVSIAKYVIGCLNKKDLFFFWIAQCIGGIIACIALNIIFGNEWMTNARTIPTYSLEQAACIEFILTLILVGIILWVGVYKKASNILVGGIIGTVVGSEAMIFGPITGASMNPVRTMAVAVVSGKLQYMYIYVLVIFLAGICIGGIFKGYTKLRMKDTNQIRIIKKQVA